MKFFAIRYFIVNSSLIKFPSEDDLRPKDLFIFPIITSEKVEYYKKTYTSRLLNSNHRDRYLVGYLLKSINVNLIELEENLFDEKNIKNWEKLFFIIDTIKQVIIIENKPQVASEDNVKNVLFKLTNEFVRSSGYELKLDFLIDDNAFWDIIKSSNGVYQIAFNLNAPNLFGGNKKANEWLSDLKEKHNMTRVSVDFKNDNAKLKYESEELESYRDYADSGGGSWTLGILKDGKKRRYKSQQHLRKAEIDINTENPNYLRENLSEIIQNLITVINKLDNFDEK